MFGQLSHEHERRGRRHTASEAESELRSRSQASACSWVSSGMASQTLGRAQVEVPVEVVTKVQNYPSKEFAGRDMLRWALSRMLAGVDEQPCQRPALAPVIAQQRYSWAAPGDQRHRGQTESPPRNRVACDGAYRAITVSRHQWLSAIPLMPRSVSAQRPRSPISVSRSVSVQRPRSVSVHRERESSYQVPPARSIPAPMAQMAPLASVQVAYTADEDMSPSAFSPVPPAHACREMRRSGPPTVTTVPVPTSSAGTPGGSMPSSPGAPALQKRVLTMHSVPAPAAASLASPRRPVSRAKEVVVPVSPLQVASVASPQRDATMIPAPSPVKMPVGPPQRAVQAQKVKKRVAAVIDNGTATVSKPAADAEDHKVLVGKPDDGSLRPTRASAPQPDAEASPERCQRPRSVSEGSKSVPEAEVEADDDKELQWASKAQALRNCEDDFACVRDAKPAARQSVYERLKREVDVTAEAINVTASVSCLQSIEPAPAARPSFLRLVWMLRRLELNDPNLKELDFRKTDVANDYPSLVPRVFKALAGSTYLEKLDMTRTSITALEGHTLASALVQNTSLLVLNIEENGITPDTLQGVFAHIDANADSALEELRFDAQIDVPKADKDTFKALAEMLTRNRKLCKIGMTLTDAHWRDQILRGLIRNLDLHRQERLQRKRAKRQARQANAVTA